MEECLNLIDIKLEELKEQMRAHEAYHVEELVIKIDEKFLDPTSSEVEERKMYEINVHIGEIIGISCQSY